MEPNPTKQPLAVEKLAMWICHRFCEYRIPFLASFIFGALAYTFAFTNKLINHDEAGQLFGKGATITSGRWGLELIDRIFPNFSMPWIYGMITVVLIAISICIIIRIFSIESKLLQVLLSGNIMVFPSLIGLFGYMFTSSSYAVAFVLAVISVWFIQKPSKLYSLPALVCLVLSLSIYQSYVSIAASLLVLLLIQKLLHGEDIVPVLLKGIYYVVFLVASMALYYIATQFVLLIKDISFNDYASGSITLSFSSILDGIRLAYLNFARFFYWAHHRLMPTSLSRRIHFLLFVSIGILLLIWMFQQKRKNIVQFAFLAVLVAILPLAINCMYLITAEDSIHTLVLYSFIAVYVLAAILADVLLPAVLPSKLPELCRRIALNFITIALATIIIINTYVANAAYLNLYLRYENAYSFYSTLIADIKMMPEFNEETKLAIVGNWDSPDFYESQLDFTYYLVGTTGFMPTTYTQQAFMEYYLGFSIPFASDEEINTITQTEEFAQMAKYPYYGSMQFFDNILVVKLS